MIRERQQDNPAYSFLFGGEGHSYYRYQLWLSSFPSGGPYNSPSPMDMLRPPINPMMNPSSLGGLIMHQPPFAPPFYEHHHHSQPFAGPGPGPTDYDQSSRTFKGLSGPLPSDVAMELSNVLTNLTGTKESIKGAKIWFMQRSPFAPALAEALRDRVFAMDDSERQLYIVYLVNDILFDSLQRRNNPRELDNEALAFKPVLGSMLGRVYHNPQNRGENQPRLQKILQFWGSKEVYDHETITLLENEMIGGSTSNLFTGPSKELLSSFTDPSGAGLRQQTTNFSSPHWQPDKQGTLPTVLGHPDKLIPSIPSFAGSSMPILSSIPPTNQQHLPSAPHRLPPSSAPSGEKLPPYPLFPPGLIPGMVKKMQIGSGVPYSPLSPLDIPTMIPPSSISESEILNRVSKFFKEIGEVNPLEGPTKSKDEYDDYERESPVRKGGACIPPPKNLQIDPETGTYPDGSVDRKNGGSGRLGLGASADPNEESQYDDVYSSYRKQRSSNYHTTMSTRAAAAK